jgi:hypothetical protein
VASAGQALATSSIALVSQAGAATPFVGFYGHWWVLAALLQSDVLLELERNAQEQG